MLFTLGQILLMIVGLIFAPFMTIGVVLFMFDWHILGIIFFVIGIFRMINTD